MSFLIRCPAITVPFGQTGFFHSRTRIVSCCAVSCVSAVWLNIRLQNTLRAGPNVRWGGDFGQNYPPTRVKVQLPCHGLRKWSAALNNCDWKRADAMIIRGVLCGAAISSKSCYEVRSQSVRPAARGRYIDFCYIASAGVQPMHTCNGCDADSNCTID
jgi:hypothetical protein